MGNTKVQWISPRDRPELQQFTGRRAAAGIQSSASARRDLLAQSTA
jgi:hypothetical protein